MIFNIDNPYLYNFIKEIYSSKLNVAKTHDKNTSCDSDLSIHNNKATNNMYGKEMILILKYAMDW